MLRIRVLPLTSATIPEYSDFTVGMDPALESSWSPVDLTAAITASPRIVLAKLELLVSKAPAPPPPPPPPAPTREAPLRLDWPSPVTAARISAVLVSTMRALMLQTALESRFCTPPRPNLPSPYPAPPTVVL